MMHRTLTFPSLGYLCACSQRALGIRTPQFPLLISFTKLAIVITLILISWDLTDFVNEEDIKLVQLDRCLYLNSWFPLAITAHSLLFLPFVAFFCSQSVIRPKKLDFNSMQQVISRLLLPKMRVNHPILAQVHISCIGAGFINLGKFNDKMLQFVRHYVQNNILFF